jgi:hypothetical protein
MRRFQEEYFQVILKKQMLVVDMFVPHQQIKSSDFEATVDASLADFTVTERCLLY